jgi:hypothetical protein
MTDTRPPDIPIEVEPKLYAYLARLNAWAFESFKGKIPVKEATHAVLLMSPGGKVYSITVTDAGALTTTLVPLGSHA